MADAFKAELLSDLQAVSHGDRLQIYGVIYPIGLFPRPIRTYPALWIAQGKAQKGSRVTVEVTDRGILITAVD